MFYISRNHRMGIRFFAVLVAAVVVAGLTMSAFAQPEEEQARQAKIDSFIKIAQEQVKRGFYQYAQAELDKAATPEFASFVSESQKKEIATLLETIQAAAVQRQVIAQTLEQSNTLSAQGNYTQAAALLRTIEGSSYISEQENRLSPLH
jgi:hypothetical protein